MSSYLFFFFFFSGCSINAKHGKAMIWVCKLKAESRSDGD